MKKLKIRILNFSHKLLYIKLYFILLKRLPHFLITTFASRCPFRLEDASSLTYEFLEKNDKEIFF